MIGKIKFYNFGKGWGMIESTDAPINTDSPVNGVYFHISNVVGELRELFEVKKVYDEPLVFETRASKVKSNQMEAFNIRLDLSQRSVGHITEFNNGYGWIQDFHSKEKYFAHFSKIKGANEKFISIEIGDPVVFTKNDNEKGKEALAIVKVDTRSALEYFAEFNDFNESVINLNAKAEPENWDYIKNPSSGLPVLWSYINYTFERILAQKKIIEGKSSKDRMEYAYFNTGLVTPMQDEIYGYFVKIQTIDKADLWHLQQPKYEFLEFETEQSRYRKFFPNAPEIATYFAEAEIRELVFDTYLNNGKIIVDREHIKNRKSRFPAKFAGMDDESFFDQIEKSIELATKRVRRNYKTAIPHFYDGKIQFLLPLCMQTKRDADLALVVNKEEYVYKAHTALTLDQAYNNARLLAKPDREWLNP